MSYEGYVVYYCKNGHRVGSRDFYDYLDEYSNCPDCGEKITYENHVDQTNGCFCNELPEGEKCEAHEKELRIIKYDSFDCKKCSGYKNITLTTEFKNSDCLQCNKENRETCPHCFGTGIIRIEKSFSISHCLDCRGTGKRFVPVFDVSELVK